MCCVYSTVILQPFLDQAFSLSQNDRRRLYRIEKGILNCCGLVISFCRVRFYRAPESTVRWSRQQMIVKILVEISGFQTTVGLTFLFFLFVFYYILIVPCRAPPSFKRIGTSAVPSHFQMSVILLCYVHQGLCYMIDLWSTSKFSRLPRSTKKRLKINKNNLNNALFYNFTKQTFLIYLIANYYLKKKIIKRKNSLQKSCLFIFWKKFKKRRKGVVIKLISQSTCWPPLMYIFWHFRFIVSHIFIYLLDVSFLVLFYKCTLCCIKFVMFFSPRQ